MPKQAKKSARPAAKPVAKKPATLKALALPALKKGEIYAGILLKDGAPAHHLILLPGHKTTPIKWDNAVAWAKAEGGELPTRKEQALLFANAAAHFEERYYWSSEVHPVDADCAFIQGFGCGGQSYVLMGFDYRARAVRRVAI